MADQVTDAIKLERVKLALAELIARRDQLEGVLKVPRQGESYDVTITMLNWERWGIVSAIDKIEDALGLPRSTQGT